MGETQRDGDGCSRDEWPGQVSSTRGSEVVGRGESPQLEEQEKEKPERAEGRRAKGGGARVWEGPSSNEGRAMS
jgi:hypothetical protein